jgi:hypothetical protein
MRRETLERTRGYRKIRRWGRGKVFNLSVFKVTILEPDF